MSAIECIQKTSKAPIPYPKAGYNGVTNRDVSGVAFRSTAENGNIALVVPLSGRAMSFGVIVKRVSPKVFAPVIHLLPKLTKWRLGMLDIAWLFCHKSLRSSREN